MSDQESDDDQRRDALLLRLLKTPPKSRAELAEELRRAKAEARKDRVIMGVLTPPGLRWQILGKWPDGRTEDILREMDREGPPPEPSSQPPKTERKARRSSRRKYPVAETRQKSRS